MAFRMSEQPRTIKIYNLLAGTNEFIGEGDAYIPPHTGLPANSTDIMIEQINIALDQKGSGNFSAWVIEACRRRLCSEKRVSPEANKEKSDITELLRKQIRPD